MGLLLCVSGLSALPMSPVTRGSAPQNSMAWLSGSETYRRIEPSPWGIVPSTSKPASVSLSAIFATSS